MATQVPISLVQPKLQSMDTSNTDSLTEPSAGHGELVRNPGIPLDLQQLDKIRVNKSAVERRCAGYGAVAVIKSSSRRLGCLKPSL